MRGGGGCWWPRGSAGLVRKACGFDLVQCVGRVSEGEQLGDVRRWFEAAQSLCCGLASLLPRGNAAKTCKWRFAAELCPAWKVLATVSVGYFSLAICCRVEGSVRRATLFWPGVVARHSKPSIEQTPSTERFIKPNQPTESCMFLFKPRRHS